MRFIILISTFSFVFGFFDDDLGFEKDPPLVRISSGRLRGSWDETSNGRAFAKFEGIPFARPPVGNLRFQPPHPVEPWSGIFNASGIGQDPCLQYDPFFVQVAGSEDCLFINVYTPQVDPAAGLPVLVLIHGGAFLFGTGNINDPVMIMDYDMVVVTFNYRLGPLGFLSTGDEVVPGNLGLKDQVAALKWVKRNIKNFGGNPKSVTLSGASAGAASVHYHYLSPLSRGLFTRGIAWSGSAFVPWALTTKPVEKTKQLAELVNCPTGNSYDMVDCLIDLPGEVIVNASIKMFPWKVQVFSPFAPVVEPEGVEEAFLTVHPYEATSTGGMYPAPLIASVTTHEGLFPGAAYQKKDEDLLPEIEENWNYLARDIFLYNDTLPAPKRTDVSAKIKEYYLHGEPVSQETYQALIQAMGDRLFVSGVGKMAELHAATTDQPVYMYQYGFRGNKSATFAFTWDYEDYGVSHSDDFFHVFFVPFMTSTSKEDMKMTQAFLDMIYSFSTSGVPKLPKVAPKWQPLHPGDPDLNVLFIRSPSDYKMKKTSNIGHRSFWDSLGFNEDQNYRSIY